MVKSNQLADIPPHDADEKIQAQLDLFELIDPDPKKKTPFSNTVDLYDALPKYIWSKREVQDMQDAEMVREIKINGQDYTIKVTPAMIKRNGRNIMVFPSSREEIVEKVLRKFVVEGQGHIAGQEVGVTFTLYQLYNELVAHGRTISYQELVEAIEVCQGARLEVTTHSGQTVVRNNFFPTVALTTKAEYINSAGDTKCYARFNPMVTESIVNMTFRRYNYDVDMAIPSALARYMHQRMSHYWTQSSLNNPYCLSLMSYLSASPRGISKLMSTNIRAMNNALDTLIKHEVLSHVEEKRIKEGRKVLDIRYTLYPHEKFVDQMIAHNRHHNQLCARSLQDDVTKSPEKIAEIKE